MKKYITAFVLLFSCAAYAQDDMQAYLDSLNAAEAGNQPKDYTTATFKTTRIVNFPSSETTGKQLLDFRIMHRFGEVYSGNGNFAKDFFGNFFGFDKAAGIKIEFDYGVNEWLTFGIGRSSYDKIVDGTVKTRILRQTMDGKMPISMTYQGTINCTAKPSPQNSDKYDLFTSRLSYSNTLIIAKKFGDKFSLELVGFHVHYNMVDDRTYTNDIFAAGIAGRYKLSPRTALTFEYAYRINEYEPGSRTKYQDPLSVGLDIETGGHVFQVHITNGYGINEVQFIPYSTSNAFKGMLRLGFNISRVFTTRKHEGSTW